MGAVAVVPPSELGAVAVRSGSGRVSVPALLGLVAAPGDGQQAKRNGDTNNMKPEQMSQETRAQRNKVLDGAAQVFSNAIEAIRRGDWAVGLTALKQAVAVLDEVHTAEIESAAAAAPVGAAA